MPFYLIALGGFMAITAEAASMVSIIWTLAARGKPGLALGLCLGGASLIPFIVQQLSSTARRTLSQMPAKAMMGVTCGGSLCCALLLAFRDQDEMLYFVAALLSIVYFLSNQCIEMLFSLTVIGKMTEPSSASRGLQGVTTSGACFGGLLAGTLLDQSGMAATIIVAAAAYGISALPILCLTAVDWRVADSTCDRSALEKHADMNSDWSSIGVAAAFGTLITIAMSIGAFNVCLPFVANSERQWSATAFGLIDGCAGIGAFAASLISLQTSRRWFSNMAPALLLLAGMSLAVATNSAIAAICALVWGFCMNGVRIKARTEFFKLSTDSHKARTWSSRLTLGRTVAESIAPAAAGLSVSHVAPSYALVGVHLITFVSLVALGAWNTLAARQDAPAMEKERNAEAVIL